MEVDEDASAPATAAAKAPVTAPPATPVMSAAAAGMASVQLRELARLLGIEDAARGDGAGSSSGGSGGTGGSTAGPLLADVGAKLRQLVGQLPTSFFVPMLKAGQLGEGQEGVLREVDGALRQEYRVRRKMLIERVKVRAWPLCAVRWWLRFCQGGIC